MNKKRVTSAEIVDFLEFDAIRATTVVFMRKRIHTTDRTPYRYSRFYVGRGVSRVVLKDVYNGGRFKLYVNFSRVPVSKISPKVVAINLSKKFPEYSVYYSKYDVYVYLRGKPNFMVKKV